MIKKLRCFLEKPFDTLSNLSAVFKPVSFIPPRSGAAPLEKDLKMKLTIPIRRCFAGINFHRGTNHIAR